MRFMRTMSVGRKLWATTFVLIVPLLGLGAFYVHSVGVELLATTKERDGYRLLQPLDQVSRDIARHAELAAITLAHITDGGSQMRRLEEEIGTTLQRLAGIDAAVGNVKTHAQLSDLAAQWTALMASKPVTAADSIGAHQATLNAIDVLTNEIGSDFSMTHDPELASYNLINVTLTKLPDSRRYLTEARAHMAAMSAGGEYVPAEGAKLISLISLIDDRVGAARDRLGWAAKGTADRPELDKQMVALGEAWDAPIANWSADVTRVMSSGHPSLETVRHLIDSSALLTESLNVTQDAVIRMANTALQIRQQGQVRSAVLVLSASVLALLAGILIMLALARRIAGAIGRLLQIADRVGNGHYDNRIDEAGTDEISRLFAGMSRMQNTLREQIESARAKAIENGRIRSALDHVSGCVMVANAKGEIIYTNRAIEELLRRAEADIRTQLPRFSAGSVLGSNLDIFHKQPEHINRMLESLTTAHTAALELGGWTFRLTVNPVLAGDGQRMGSVLEWADRTVEASLERETQHVLSEVLAGRLGQRIDLTGKSGFFAVLGQGMNRLADNIQEIILKVKVTSTEVHRAAQEISQGNANLSQRTEEQSSSLEQTASSMEQMTSTVKQNADNATHANQLASAAREQAQAGGEVVNQAIRAMAEINDSSKRIANIIGVIDEIAFQTNLLALNAAVEAARAGEQGRGFAVVATEVRSLAGRSAEAAREIKELISDSVKKVEGGSILVTKSGQTLEQIVIAVKKVTDVIAEIAAASREQAAGLDHINVAVTQMDDMTQQNAALVEEATAASQSMADQAGELAGMLAHYQTENATPKTAGQRRAAATHSNAAPVRAVPLARAAGG